MLSIVDSENDYILVFFNGLCFEGFEFSGDMFIKINIFWQQNKE